MADELQDGSEVVDFRLTEDELVNKRKTQNCMQIIIKHKKQYCAAFNQTRFFFLPPQSAHTRLIYFVHVHACVRTCRCICVCRW